MVATAAEAMHTNWFDATLLGPLTSTPFKFYAITGPHAGVSLPAFTLAAIAARLPRFLIVSVGVAWIVEPHLRARPIGPCWQPTGLRRIGRKLSGRLRRGARLLLERK